MKIIVIHYRYYESSGPERYLFNISEVLRMKGHVVIPFSLSYPKNNYTEYSKYFPKPVLAEFHINQQTTSISLINKLKIIRNGFYNQEAFKKLEELISVTNPDVAYVLQYSTKLSTSIFDVLSENKIPVVLRLSDFNLICAKNILYREGNICLKCINHKYYSVIHKCVNDNVLQSLIYYGIQKVDQYKHFEKKIDAIVTPSKFTYNLLKKTKQFKKSKIIHIPTFINKPIINNNSQLNYDIKNGLKLCYVGRVAEDKGIDILIDSIKAVTEKGLKISLDLIGDDRNEFSDQLKIKIQKSGLTNIIFKGYMSGEESKKVFTNYHYSAIPSKWYDNMPNSLIESCIVGIPVIVSGHGSLEELIKDDFNGYTFEPFNSKSLSDVIESLYLIDNTKYRRLSENASKWIADYCDEDKHYVKLMSLFNSLINEKVNK